MYPIGKLQVTYGFSTDNDIPLLKNKKSQDMMISLGCQDDLNRYIKHQNKDILLKYHKCIIRIVPHIRS
jgi:hypothetical protein